MTDYSSMKPVLLLPAATYLDAQDGDAGPVIDTIGYCKLWMITNTGEAEGSVYQRHQLQSSPDGTTFTAISGALSLAFGTQGGTLIGDAPAVGGKQTVSQGWIDLTPEDRYIRVVIDRTSNSVGATDEMPVAITGILCDPTDTQYAGTALYHDGTSATTGYTEPPFFKKDAHNRA